MTISRVAIYARVSTELKPTKNKDHTAYKRDQDTENQLGELRVFCQNSGWLVVEEYVDRASGKSGDRQHFKRMFADAAQRRFDLVLFWAIDRFSREGTLQTLKYLESLNTAGVAWRSFQEPFFDSCGPFTDAVISIMATLAQQERLRISERTKAGLRKAVAEGKKLGRRPSLAIDHKTLKQMRELQGKSLRTISRETGISLTSVVRALRAA